MTESNEPIYYVTRGQLDNVREVLGEVVQLLEDLMVQFNRLGERQQCVYFDEELTPVGTGPRTERSMVPRGSAGDGVDRG